MTLYDIKHIQEARPIHTVILLLTGILSLVSCVGGIIAIFWNAFAPSEINMLGLHVSTGHVGVAFAALGVISMFLVSRSVLKNLSVLGKIKDAD